MQCTVTLESIETASLSANFNALKFNLIFIKKSSFSHSNSKVMTILEWLL